LFLRDNLPHYRLKGSGAVPFVALEFDDERDDVADLEEVFVVASPPIQEFYRRILCEPKGEVMAFAPDRATLRDSDILQEPERARIANAKRTKTVDHIEGLERECVRRYDALDA